MARVALGLTGKQLADLAGVSLNTTNRLEGGEELRKRTVAAIRAALEAAGIQFIDQNGHGPGVRLRDRIEPKGAAPDLGAADGQ